MTDTPMRPVTSLEAKKFKEFQRRRNMALAMFRPMAHQEPFFREYAREFLCRGGNRSGKSTCAAAKFASIACNFPITLDDGTIIDQRQPWQRDRPLVMWIIGYDLQHIGQTIHRLLFKAGLFKVIRDEVTGLHRTFKPWMEQDQKREDEAKPSPPLIPARYVDQNSWVWENKKAKEFKKVIIRDPLTRKELAEIYCFSSKADPKAGDPVDVIWIDESIENPTHYGEWQARLVDRRGNLFWSSWPNSNNDALQNLSERAIKEAEKEAPLVREMVITLSDNKALSEQARMEALGMFSTEEEKRARDKGEYVNDLVRMYPLFNEIIHQAVYPSGGDKLSTFLESQGGVPPHDWTHEMILDPGTQSPGVLFCAVPPPEYGENYVIYDEITERADAEQLAELIRKKFGGREFNRFIIDAKAGAQHGMGYVITVTDNYSKAFAKRNIKCRLTGSGFSLGCTDVGARIMALQEWMHIGRSGFPKLRIVRGTCPKLCEQLRKYKKSSVNNDVRDDRPAAGQKLDLAVSAEYWAASYPMYVVSERSDPKDPSYDDDPWYKQFFGSRNRETSKKVHKIGPQY